MRLIDVIDEKFRTCGADLMTAYNVRLALSNKTADTDNRFQTHERAAIIGYSGGSIPSGSIALWLDQSILKGFGETFNDQSDWLSELLNQLTGRVINQLHPFGVLLQQSTPVVVNSSNLNITFSGKRTSRYSFTTPTSQPAMEVFFDFSFQPDHEVQLDKDSSPIPEGESIIF